MAMSASRAAFVALFTPKLITVLREGYGRADLRADAIAGLTVAIVALPLSMAIAIASGVGPERGLYTAIVGGFIVSLLGGSRFQIGGPAGAFIVLVSSIVQIHGLDGLILATLLSGLILVAVGLLQLGTFVRYVPYPVTVGFTAGIATIIFASQIKELLGLTLSGPEPGALLPKLIALGEALPTASPAAVAIAGLTIVAIALGRRYRPRWPVLLIAVTLASIGAWALGLQIDTIGTRFGGIPNSLPAPHLPSLSLDKVLAVLPSAGALALLGSIESLLSAVVADSMTGSRHRSNGELVAQGLANVGSALFGGICVTGTIARTATNVRAGARGPISGMLHSMFLLAFMLVAAPLAGYIPLAALAGVLATVAWTMAERHAIGILVRASRGDAAVVLVTFLLTVFRDLIEGITVGFALSALLFMHRMARSVRVEESMPVAAFDQPDEMDREPYDHALAADPDLVVSRLSGAFFFGAAASVSATLDRIAAHPGAVILDLTEVPFLDSSAAATIAGVVRRSALRGTMVQIAGANPAVRHALLLHGAGRPHARFRARVADAIATARAQAAKNRMNQSSTSVGASSLT